MKEIKFPIHYKNLIIDTKSIGGRELLVIKQIGRYGNERVEIPVETNGHPGWVRFVDLNGKSREIMSSGDWDHFNKGDKAGIESELIDTLADMLNISTASLREAIDQANFNIKLADAIKSLEEHARQKTWSDQRHRDLV